MEINVRQRKRRPLQFTELCGCHEKKVVLSLPLSLLPHFSTGNGCIQDRDYNGENNRVRKCKPSGLSNQTATFTSLTGLLSLLHLPRLLFPLSVPHTGNDCTIQDGDYNGENDRVRKCKLSGMPDLATEDGGYVRPHQTAFLNKLISLGVTGFRIDAAKHMYPADIYAILSAADDVVGADGKTKRPFLYNEVLPNDKGIKGESHCIFIMFIFVPFFCGFHFFPFCVCFEKCSQPPEMATSVRLPP